MTPSQSIVHALSMQRIAHAKYKRECRKAYRSKAVRESRAVFRGFQAELDRLMMEREKARK